MISFVLVGNKCDLGQSKIKVSSDEAEDFAKKNGMKYIEVSAKTGANVSQPFSEIADIIYKKVESKEINLDIPDLGVKRKEREKMDSIDLSRGMHVKEKHCSC
eukprot:TRINITY_DN8727_c0_g1_i18.p2 TRINITY_DN8727_c0_g1~~TRINITY_DN8727_c0_g1_i18.p2  ORF type:complete len:103 (+),score=18.89 TRINITY_DN8727_c0_g1_i18:502-810(+)